MLAPDVWRNRDEIRGNVRENEKWKTILPTRRCTKTPIKNLAHDLQQRIELLLEHSMDVNNNKIYYLSMLSLTNAIHRIIYGYIETSAMNWINKKWTCKVIGFESTEEDGRQWLHVFLTNRKNFVHIKIYLPLLWYQFHDFVLYNDHTPCTHTRTHAYTFYWRGMFKYV